MPKSLVRIAVSSFWTAVSRILGLIRDIALYALLGSSTANAAFLTAFTLPNLFRRLLGEGALASATLPVLTSEHDREGMAGLSGLINRVLTRLMAVAGVLLLLICSLLLVAAVFLPEGSRWKLTAAYGTVLFPYIAPICAAGILGAGLNLLGRFAIPAFTPVALNLCLLAAAGIAVITGTEDLVSIGWLLCGGVLAGGILQALLPAVALRRLGWQPAVDPSPSSSLQEVWKLFIRGTAGAAISQVNLVVSRLLAMIAGPAAVTHLFLAARLVELPLGVFGINIASVYFPQLSEHANRKDRAEFCRCADEAITLALAAIIPAAAGLALLALPVLEAFFSQGRFSVEDRDATATLLALSACALPAYTLSTLFTRIHHSRKRMEIPIRAAAWSFGCNLTLSLLFLVPFGATGLAVANIAAAWAQCAALLRELDLNDNRSSTRTILHAALRPSLAALVMAIVLLATGAVDGSGPLFSRLPEALSLASAISLGVVCYLLASLVIQPAVLRRFRRKGVPR